MTLRHEPDRDDPDSHTVVDERRHLINLGYRLLGSLAEAEDAVHEAYARWYALAPRQRDDVKVPGAWLTTVTGRICLDQLGSARARRERYVGEWIPEPLPGGASWSNPAPAEEAGVNPLDRVTLDESVTMAFLMVLESMTPAERVAFVLHDVFAYSFDEVAAVVGRTTAACRQLASSGRRRVRAAEIQQTSTARHAVVVSAFRRAWEAKDIAALVDLLDPDATATPDGGGLVDALIEPVTGAAQVARALLDISERNPDLTVLQRTVNGQPGLVAAHNGATITVLAFDVAGAQIRNIWAIRNPEKLRAWSSRWRALRGH